MLLAMTTIKLEGKYHCSRHNIIVYFDILLFPVATCSSGGTIHHITNAFCGFQQGSFIETMRSTGHSPSRFLLPAGPDIYKSRRIADWATSGNHFPALDGARSALRDLPYQPHSGHISLETYKIRPRPSSRGSYREILAITATFGIR